VAVESMWSDDFIGETIPRVENWPGEPRLIRDEKCEYLLANVANAVNRVLATETTERHVIAQENRRVLSEKHSPVVIASNFLHALGG